MFLPCAARPVLAAKSGGLYCGGSARMVEKALGVEELHSFMRLPLSKMILVLKVIAQSVFA